MATFGFNYQCTWLFLYCITLFLFVAMTAGEWDLKQHLGSKTPYFPHQNYSEYTPVPPQCQVVHLNLLARHGSRYPTSGDIKQFNKLQKIIATYGDAIPYQWMRDWVNPFELEHSGFLTVQGEFEHYELAKRMEQYFSQTFNHEYEPDLYSIQSTQVSRTGLSANSFSFGLFEGRGKIGVAKFDPFFIWNTNQSQDYLLRFFDVCTNYRQHVYKNKTAAPESKLYGNMILPPMAQKLTVRLNVTGWILSADDVETLWALCGFQVSAQNISDQFCSFFDEEDVLQLNYMADIETYWIKGYGYPITSTMPCLLFADFISAMENVIHNSVGVHALRANLRFAHAETLMPFLALLGMFKDDQPLRANTPPDKIATRQWRQSYIASFAANLALVLYNCSTQEAVDDFRVKLFHSEKEYMIPGCGELLCPYSTFKQLYNKPLTQCNFDWICGIKPCTSTSEQDGWLLSTAKTAGIIVSVGVGSFLVGLAVMGGIWLIVHFCNRSHAFEYELAPNAFTL
jgi:multiple inositol-polyphosphate phosphatase/2,3-bisphosphoglycerate 3-phosphatase